MTEYDIQNILVRLKFTTDRWLTIPNVRWSFLPYEADILSVSYKSRNVHEVEIKTTISDLKNERKKKKHYYGISEIVNFYWFAVTKKAYNEKILESYPNAGIIIINDEIDIIKKPNRLSNNSMSDLQIIKLLRLGYMRFWNQRMTPCMI